jgi:signal peptidase I
MKRLFLLMVLASSALAAIVATAFAVFGVSSDLDFRRLLGMGVIALTLFIASLIILYLPLNRNVDRHRGWLYGLSTTSLPPGKYLWRSLQGKIRQRQFYRRSDSVSPSLNREKRIGTRKNKWLVEFSIMLLVSFALLFGVVKPFIVEAFYVPSESMVPTLQVWDRVLVNRFIYRLSEPKREDIVVFESIEYGADLIKRVVGVPGDKIEVRSGTLFVNGEQQEEPYLNRELPDDRSYGPKSVPSGHVFVMGDNRADSADSRVFGPVPKENIVGEAFLRFWPPSRLDLLKVPLLNTS